MKSIIPSLVLLVVECCSGNLQARPKCRLTSSRISKAIMRIGWGYRRARSVVAKTLSTEVPRQAKRFRLDPIIMLAIASVESDFRPYAHGIQGRRSGEVGVWQLIPGDFPVIRARKTLVRLCWPGRGNPHPNCPLRIRKQFLGPPARITARWLLNLRVATWVVAFELRLHIDACKRSHRKGHRWRGMPVDKVLASRLSRYGHYNTGAKPPIGRYLRKLYKRYAKFRSLLCR